MIPKVIHYCWFGGKKLPLGVKKCIKSWKHFCPDYEIKQWNEDNFDVTSHPFVKAAYEARAWAFVSDYVRLKVIYDNGGIYLDTDVELIKNIDFLLNNKCYFGFQGNAKLVNTGLGFGAEKTTFVVKKMMEKYDSINFNNGNRSSIACPWLNTEVIKEYELIPTDANEIIKNDTLTIYPPCFFDPYPSGTDICYKNENTVSIHHYAASWGSGSIKLKRKIVRFFGEYKIFEIKKRFSCKR